MSLKKLHYTELLGTTSSQTTKNDLKVLSFLCKILYLPSVIGLALQALEQAFLVWKLLLFPPHPPQVNLLQVL